MRIGDRPGSTDDGHVRATVVAAVAIEIHSPRAPTTQQDVSWPFDVQTVQSNLPQLLTLIVPLCFLRSLKLPLLVAYLSGLRRGSLQHQLPIRGINNNIISPSSAAMDKQPTGGILWTFSSRSRWNFNWLFIIHWREEFIVRYLYPEMCTSFRIVKLNTETFVFRCIDLISICCEYCWIWIVVSDVTLKCPIYTCHFTEINSTFFTKFAKHQIKIRFLNSRRSSIFLEITKAAYSLSEKWSIFSNIHQVNFIFNYIMSDLDNILP